MSSRRGSFAELVALAERAGESESLPALALAGVRNIAELTANTDRLVEAGISPITLEALLAAPPPVEAISDLAVVAAEPSRPDLPVRRDAARASLTAGGGGSAGQRQAGGHGAPRQHARQVHQGAL